MEQPLGNFLKDSSRCDGLNNKCIDCTKNYQREHREKNRERYRKYAEKYCKENKEMIAEMRRVYFQQNKKYIYEKRKQRRNKRYNERMSSDPLYKISQNIRALIKNSFKRKKLKKTSKTVDILGCSLEHFKSHIENQFVSGMSWDNRSEWHIDHIIPLASAKTEEDIIKLNHYTNLQPLWAKDNIKKGAKITGGLNIYPLAKNV